MSRRPVVPVLLGALLVALVLGTVPATATASPLASSHTTTGTATTAGTAAQGDRAAEPRRPHASDRVLTRDTVAPSARGVRRWPGHRIRYWAKLPTDFRWSLAAALRAWNGTGLHMRFVRAPRSKARLTITVGDTLGADGLATVGYQARNWVRLAPTLVDRQYDESEAYARVVAAHVIAHELGHNLGLQHSRGCQLMTAVLYLPHCRMMDADQPGYYACRVVDKHALAKTVALYGGRRTQAPAACPVDPLPPDLKGVGFEGGQAAGAPIRLTWDPPARAPAGSRVLALVTSGAACRFPVAQDFYGEAAYDASSLRVKALDPAKGSWEPPTTGSETHCYALRLVNRSGAGSRLSSRALSGWVPPAPTPPTPSITDLVNDFGTVTGRTDIDPDVFGLAVVEAPTGACVGTFPAGADPRESPYPAYVYSDAGQVLFETYAYGDSPCLTFFAYNADGVVGPGVQEQL